MKRILINATHTEEIRVALCKDNHLYDFDLENRTREQKKANIYKGHITRIEPSLEAAFVEYGSVRQGFLPLREIAGEYLNGNAREDNIRQLIKEGDEVIVQVEKEERGNKGAALSTYISLAGRYLVLMPNNAKAGGISRQISGKVREEMKQIIANLNLPKGMSVIVRTAGLGKGAEDLQNDLDHLLDIWHSIQEQNRTRPSPCLVHQEAGVVTRAVRDYLRDDIGEIWIDNENAYNEAANFIAAVMPAQMSKLRKYTEYEPMFARFGIERQIETAYQREVRLPSGGSIVIDQTEALVSIDINSSKSTKGSDVAETAYHTNLEAADEIARQLRLRDMGGLIVIDFIDMNDARHQKDVEKRLIEATKYDRARVQFAEISKFGLMEMSRQRLRPSLEEATGYICPRCHGNGLIRDLRSLSLSIMRQIEQIALKERIGEVQAEVPTDIAAFLLNEKRESLVYLEQDSGVRITILPHAHLESPNFSLHFNPDGFTPSSYERIADTEEKETIDRGYEVNWQNAHEKDSSTHWHKSTKNSEDTKTHKKSEIIKDEPKAVAWLSNLFAPKPQAKLVGSLDSQEVALAIESLVNDGRTSLGSSGFINDTIAQNNCKNEPVRKEKEEVRPAKNKKQTKKETVIEEIIPEKNDKKAKKESKDNKEKEYAKRESGSRRESRGEIVRHEVLTPKTTKSEKQDTVEKTKAEIKTEKNNRQKTDSEIVLHISQAESPDIQKNVVHIQLDDSKTDLVSEKLDPAPKKESVKQKKTRSLEADKTIIQPDVETTQEDVNATSNINLEQTPAHSTAFEDTLQQIAKKMNKAVNDPRVVQVALSTQSKANLSGTAGSFVDLVLGHRSANFVYDFIQAIEIYQKQAVDFDFRNFGYSPLADDYVAAFLSKTQAVASVSAPQGKTQTSLPPITKRAANDPRGQHPDFVENQDAHAITQNIATKPTKVSNATDVASLEDANTTDASQTIDNVQQVEIVDSGLEQTQSIQPVITQESNVSKTSADDIAELVEDILATQEHEKTQANEDVQTTVGQVKQMRANQKVEKKNKPNSYKDMIENVAGQLQPQQIGILNLMTTKASKIPKTRTRKASKKDNKPKAVVKKINKSESVLTEKLDPSTNQED